jgi:hypothetical protein
MRSNWRTPVVTRPSVVIENVARRSYDWPWQRTLELLPAIKRAGSDINSTELSHGALPSNRETHRNFDTTVS